MIVEYKKGQVLKLSNDFNVKDFHCHCSHPSCTFTYVDTDLVDYLQKKRDEIGMPIYLDCGFRCTLHNKEVGGKIGSQHLTGKAADITLGFVSDIVEMADKFDDSPGLGKYPTKKFLHVDQAYGPGGKKRRWIG